MALFERFYDTIFIKEDNSLEKQLEELKQIRDTVEEKDKIDKQIKILEYGIQGENEIAFELKNANLGMYVLHDVVIPVDDLTAQIDYVIITKAYAYLVECKNLIGNITVDNKGEFKREYNYNGKNIKEAIYSPYTQAQRHKDILMKRWYKRHGKIDTLLFENYTKKYYKPLIVLSNSKGLLNLKYAPKEIKECTIRVDELVNYIKRDINSYDKDSLLSKKQMLGNAQSFLDIHEEKEISLKNQYSIVENKNETTIEDNATNKEELIKRLKEFRLQKSKQKGIPAYYIFNDSELMDIIDKNIKSLEDLKNSNILNNTKFNLHGEDIIKVINEIIK